MPELNHDRIVSYNAENDKSTSLSIGVYMGNASLTVFSNKLIATKFSFQRSFLTLLRRGLIKILAGKPGDKEPYTFTKYDPETKKSNPTGSLFVGRDDKGIIYLGVSAPGKTPAKFLVRSGLSFDTNNAMTDVQRSELEAETLIDQLKYDIPFARMLTSFKREGGMQQRPGAGGYGGGGAKAGGDESNIFG